MVAFCYRIRRWLIVLFVLVCLQLSFGIYRFYREINEISTRNTMTNDKSVVGAPVFTDTVPKVGKIEKSAIFTDTGVNDKRLSGLSGTSQTSNVNEVAEYSIKTAVVPNDGEISQPISKTRYNTDTNTGGVKSTPEFGNDLLLFTAIVGNTSDNSSWNKISIQGWQESSLRETTFSFCVHHRSGVVKQYSNVTRHFSQFHEMVKSIATQFVCHLGEDYKHDPPEYVTITNRTGPLACQIDFSFFLKTSFAFRHPGEIAVFAKIVFGSLSADAVISWFEIHKLLGFNKVYVYPHELNPSAMKVFRHYEKEGKAELIPFYKPGPEHGKHSVKVGTKNVQGWSDKLVALFDGIERLRGYDYLVAFDVDEYLIPTGGNTWRDLFDTIFSQHPRLAGAMFYTYLYLKDWGPTSGNSPFDVACYLNRTGPTNDRPKHVVKPARIADVGLNVHNFIPLLGYKKASAYTCPVDMAGIYHYRMCRRDWIAKNTTVQCTSERIFDDGVYKLFKTVENKIINLKNKLGV